MDAADFYEHFCDTVDSLHKSIKKTTKNNKPAKESNKSEKAETRHVEQRSFDNVNSVMQHLEENKKSAISVRDELCEKFGKDEGQKIYRFLKQLATRASEHAGAEMGTAISGILFTPGGGVFTCIGSRR